MADDGDDFRAVGSGPQAPDRSLHLGRTRGVDGDQDQVQARRQAVGPTVAKLLKADLREQGRERGELLVASDHPIDDPDALHVITPWTNARGRKFRVPRYLGQFSYSKLD